MTAEISRAWGLDFRLLPMADELAPTMVSVNPDDDPGIDGNGLISFQEYFVRHHHSIPVRKLRLGSVSTQPTPEVSAAISNADVVVIAPSNPFVSVGPIRSLPGIDSALAARRNSVVAISPLVGGAAIKGPAADMMSAFGFRTDAAGIAEVYRDICGHLVIDEVDRSLSDAVGETGLSVTVTNTMMGDPMVDEILARATLAAAGIGR
ncbi:MAG: 2-phospho-L-lactate transferase CofD family protein [Ilumatobacteraceae bacterium]